MGGGVGRVGEKKVEREQREKEKGSGNLKNYLRKGSEMGCRGGGVYWDFWGCCSVLSGGGAEETEGLYVY